MLIHARQALHFQISIIIQVEFEIWIPRLSDYIDENE